MDAGVAGLIGAGIGAGVSLLTIWIQAHYQSKREKARAILEYALMHRREAFEYADKVAGPLTVEPLAVHIHYQKGLLELVDNGTLTQEAFSKLHKENDDLAESIRQAKQDRVIERVIAARTGKPQD